MADLKPLRHCNSLHAKETMTMQKQCHDLKLLKNTCNKTKIPIKVTAFVYTMEDMHKNTPGNKSIKKLLNTICYQRYGR